MKVNQVTVKIYPDHETMTGIHVSIGQLNFDLKDKEAQSLIEQLFSYRDDLFENLDNSKQVLEDKVKSLEIENKELEDEVSNLKDQIEDLENSNY